MANTQTPTATPQQIQAFKAGAVQRYQERGVPYEQAEALFGAFMAKQAEAAGLMPEPATAKVEKIAAFLKGKIKQPVKK